MPWDRGYYYRAVRIGGKPTRVFVGGGLLGELAAKLDEHERARRAGAADQLRLQRHKDRETHRAIDTQYRGLRGAVWELLQAAGYYQHKREWRKMGKQAQLARGGEPEYRPALPGELQEKDLGNARALSGLMVAEQIVSAYCKGQAEAQAVIRHELRTLCRDLGLDDAPPFERELIAHVAECWVWLKLAQLTLNRISSAEHTFREGEYRERRVTEAQRRYLRAMNLLAKVRHLGPAVQINLANQQVVMNGRTEGPD